MSTGSILGRCPLPGTPFLWEKSVASSLNRDWGGGELGCPLDRPGLNVYMLYSVITDIYVYKKWYIIKGKKNFVTFVCGWADDLPASSCMSALVPIT